MITRPRAGVTLMELLIVLLIIGLLGTMAVRTITATRNRGLFEQTRTEMQGLVNAIVGNPNLITDGRRVDFGYYGDHGELPADLRDLVDDTGDSRWRGPYLRKEFLADSIGYLFDAWGNPYSYDPALGEISTIGDGTNTMTMRVADTLVHLTGNTIFGMVTDAEGRPPGEDFEVFMELKLSNDTLADTVAPSGYYAFEGVVPIGIHELSATYETFSVIRSVSVSPRTRNVVDLRFSQLFSNYLRLAAEPELAAGSDGFTVTVINVHDQPVEIISVLFLSAPANAYFREFTWEGVTQPGYPVPEPGLGYGLGDLMPFNRVTPTTIYTIPAYESVTLGLLDCRVNQDGSGGQADISDGYFHLRFSDGSEVGFTLPGSP